MPCDRNHPCTPERFADQVANSLDRENPNVSNMLLEASGMYQNPRQMQHFVDQVQNREDPRKGDNLEVARDGRILISKFNGSVEVLPIDVTGARIRQSAGEYHGAGSYHNKQAAGIGDYVQRGAVGALTGLAINGHDRGKGALQGGVGAVGGKAIKETTGQEGATGVVVETLGACAVGALIGGKDGCKNGAAGSGVSQGLEWLMNKNKKQ